MSHTVTLELKLTLSRSGMVEVSEQLLENDVDHMVNQLRSYFSVDDQKCTITSKRKEEPNATQS